jgi:ferredoxin
MSVRITEACVSCGACVWECPLEAISPGEKRPVVDAGACTECYGFFGESQCIVVCPVDAIAVDPEPLVALGERFARINPGREPQDTWIWQRIVRKGPSEDGREQLPAE